MSTRQSRPEQCYRADMKAFRKRHGVDGARDTGPASMAEVEAARAKYGRPETHEEWIAAVAARTNPY